jgi:hypothetical protein
MIRILCQGGEEGTGRMIAQDLCDEYGLPVSPEVLSDDAIWPGAPEWNDVLLVVYRSRDVPESTREYIKAFRKAHANTPPRSNVPRPGGVVIPVAMDPGAPVPPDPISGIKALAYDDSARGPAGRLSRWVGVFLGITLRRGEHQIFISYRASDGSVIAQDLYRRLESAGFQPWLDEAVDAENMPPAADVQQVIGTHVKQASMVLVVDSPAAPQSRWIKLEIDTAIGELIPVLPVVVGEEVSRFIALSSLRRRVPVKSGGLDGLPVSDEDWARLSERVEDLLLETYRRRLRTTTRAEEVFRKNGYDWTIRDPERRVFQSDRSNPPLPTVSVLSHCSIHDVTWIPALKAFERFLHDFPAIAEISQKLCIYDRDGPLWDAQIEDIYENLNSMPFILAHRDELPLLLSSNFSSLR